MPRSSRTTPSAAARRAASRRHARRRVPDRAGPLRVRADRPRRRVRARARPEPAAEETTAALVRSAEATRRLAPLLRARLEERGAETLYREIELPLTVVLGAMEDAGVRIDTYRMGEITARLNDRVEELEARARSSPVSRSCSARPSRSRASSSRCSASPRAQGQDRVLDRHAGAANDPRGARDRRRDRGVAGATKLLSTHTSARCRP